ncbi:MAG: hypothetical protein ACYC2E_08265, partial [Sulfuricella sp.]
RQGNTNKGLFQHGSSWEAAAILSACCSGCYHIPTMISRGFPMPASGWDKRAGLWYFRALHVLERDISLEEKLAVFPAGFCCAAGGYFLVGGRLCQRHG